MNVSSQNSFTFDKPLKSVPFLSWAGGKRWLSHVVAALAPADMKYYHEPFLGGGSVFFELQPGNAVLSDSNGSLINCYNAMHKHPKELMELLKEHSDKHSPEHYYATRSEISEDLLIQAANFLYLSRACFNGLYRVNKEGKFNTPIGKGRRIITENDNFEHSSIILRNAIIDCRSYRESLEMCGPGDFVYLDPPYAVKERKKEFIEYGTSPFDFSDQIYLSEKASSLANDGVSVVASNVFDLDVVSLYMNDCFLIYKVCRPSKIMGGTTKHGRYIEMLAISKNLVCENESIDRFYRFSKKSMSNCFVRVH